MSSLQTKIRKTGRVYCVIPVGVKDGVNLVYQFPDEFLPETLEVFLGGLKLNGDQSDPDRDYTVTTTGPNAFKEITIEIDPSEPHRLNVAPCPNEELCANYDKKNIC